MYHNTSFISYGSAMHHCASITQDKSGGFFVVNYYGRECTDDQRVVIGYALKHGMIADHIKLDEKTGNPIVWNFKDEVYMICSQFTDMTEDGTPIDYGRSPVNRWKNCRNYLFKLEFDGSRIIKKKYGEILGTYGLLARCQPLVEDDRVLLPLYREEDPLCQVWRFTLDDGDPIIEKMSEFGEMSDKLSDICAKNGMTFGNLGDGVAIQPTIICKNGKYVAFCRNVCRPLFGDGDKSLAWISTSNDCIKWDSMNVCGIPNHNNSLVAVNYDSVGDLLVFNTNRSRSDMILYNVNSRNQIDLSHSFKGRKSFSYPNMIIDNDGNLHIVHTNCGVIAWHVFDESYVNNRL